MATREPHGASRGYGQYTATAIVADRSEPKQQYKYSIYFTLEGCLLLC